MPDATFAAWRRLRRPHGSPSPSGASPPVDLEPSSDLTLNGSETKVHPGPETPSRIVGAANAESKLSFALRDNHDNWTFALRGPRRFPTGGLGGGSVALR